MPPSMRLLLGIALLANGKDFNSTNDNDIQAAAKNLLLQAPDVFGYKTSDLSADDPLVTGAVVMSPMFNGDALTLQAYEKNIQYVYPEEGTNVWADYLVISDLSPHFALASQFLNYLNEPEVALANAVYVNYATPNTAAKALADEEYRNNPVIFPPPEELSKAHLIQSIPESTERRYTEALVRVFSRFELQRGAP